MNDRKKDKVSKDAHPPAYHLLCPSCGTGVETEQRFCGQCGNPLHLTCPACGTDNPLHHRFCSACGTALATASEPVTDVHRKPATDAPPEERRWVTVLFADISGFTNMSEKMDPEDVKTFVDRCVRQISEEVQRFDGTILRVVGDEVFAVFGAPFAHEDDTERAVRAGVALRDLTLLDEREKQIRVHVGINTGEVMAGFTGPPGRRDYTVEGDTVNTAARLRTAARSGTVLVGESTYQATRHVIRYRPVSPIVARGKEQPVPAWEALEVIAAPGTRPLGTAPLIGRDDELTRLQHMWRTVTRRSQPHLVTILGEPGIGKSRLVAEFERRLPQEVQVLHGRCFPYGETLGYAPLAMALKEAAGIMADDDVAMARTKLDEMVAEVMEAEGQPAEVARHLALVSGQEVEADHLMGGVDERVLHATVRRFVEAAARRRPICLVIDDIHWASDIFLDLLESVAARVRDTALLIVTQARTELLERRPAWGRSVRSFTSLPLSPLSKEVERNLILALCRERGLSDEITADISRSAGGNPLFAEEMVAMIAEGGELANVPSFLQMLISARLDTLPAKERDVIQLASVFGKVFWEGGLHALDATLKGNLVEHLEALEQKDLLRAMPHSQFRGDHEYSFKHDLIREMAHNMLPRARRRILHQGVVDWIETAAGEQAENYFDLLTHHAIEAGQKERALGYLSRAAERASRAAAHRQAAELLREAIAIAQGLDQPDTLNGLRFRHAKALLNIGRWEEARPDLEAVLANLPPDQKELRAEVLLALALVNYWVLDPVRLRAYSEEAKHLGEETDRDDLVAAATGNLAAAESSDGNLEESLRLYNVALRRAGKERFRYNAEWALHSLIYYWLGRAHHGVAYARESVELVGNDTSGTVFSLSNLGIVLVGTGDYREAARTFEEACRIGREYEIWPFLARATALSAGYHLDLFDYAGNEAVAEEARELARSAKFLPSVVSASIDLLLNYTRRQEIGRAEQLVGEVISSVEDASGFHGWLWRLRLTESQAEIAVARGDWETALRRAEDAIAQSKARGRVKYHASALRTRARALEGLGRSREAIASLRESVSLARPTGDPAMLVHAASALLAVDGDDALLQEARSAVQRISDNLEDEVLRQRFEEAEPVRLIGRLG